MNVIVAVFSVYKNSIFSIHISLHIIILHQMVDDCFIYYIIYSTYFRSSYNLNLEVNVIFKRNLKINSYGTFLKVNKHRTKHKLLQHE